jgi:hypothetical protein
MVLLDQIQADTLLAAVVAVRKIETVALLLDLADLVVVLTEANKVMVVVLDLPTPVEAVAVDLVVFLLPLVETGEVVS